MSVSLQDPEVYPTFGGLFRAKVYSVADPDKKNRVQVIVPAVNGQEALGWALPCTPLGAAVTLPKVGDALWVMFEQGDVEHPVWLGTWLGGLQ